MATKDWQANLNKILEDVNSNWRDGDKRLSPDDEKKLDAIRKSIVDPLDADWPHSEVLEFLKTHSYKDNQWLQQFIKSIPGSGTGFKILERRQLEFYDKLYKTLKDKRSKYETNEQWFNDFTKQEVKSLDQAEQWKDQYEQIKAPVPGAIKDLASIYKDRDEAKLSTKLLSMLFSKGTGSGPGFKSDWKSKKGAAKSFKQIKRPAAKAYEAFKSRTTASSTGGGGSAGAPAAATTPSTAAAPAAQVAPSVATDDEAQESTISTDDDGNATITPTDKSKPIGKKGKGASPKKPLSARKAGGGGIASKPVRGSGIEKDEDKGVIIKGYIGSDSREHSLDELFGGGAGGGGKGGSGAGGFGGYAAGAGFASQGGDGAGGGGDEEGGFNPLDLVDRYNKNKKDKDKKKKKSKKKPRKKPRGRPKPRPKPKGKLGRLARLKNLFSKGNKAKNVANVASKARTVGTVARLGGMASTIASVGGTSVSALAAGGAAATAGVAAAAAAAGFIGWKVGSYIDKKLDVSGKASDALTNVGETGRLKRQLAASNKDAKALTQKYKGKKQSIVLPSGVRRRTQVGWDKTLEQNASFIKQDEEAYKQSKKHGMWSSDADKEKEATAKRRLDFKKQSRKRLLADYKKWQKEGGDNFKEDANPALAKAKHQRDKMISLAKKYQKGSKQEEAIKAAEDQYKATELKLKEAEAKNSKKPAVDVGDIALPRTKGGARRYISGPEGRFRLSAKDGILAASGLGEY